MSIEKITLGGGCFWCIEAALQMLQGVESVVSGYAGGTTENPTYQAVCSGTTGHAEVVEVGFDNEVISLTSLLEVFFTIHNPTTLNRQGADAGTQYRSVIFFHNAEQQREAARIIEELEKEKVWSDPIVTEVLPMPAFYPAESYHQNYFKNNPGQGYCQVVISPKLAKLRAGHEGLLKS